MMKLIGSQFLKQIVPRFNPLTDSDGGFRDILSTDPIPDGHSITRFTYRSNADGSHRDTLLRVAPEVPNETLARRAFRDRRLDHEDEIGW